MDDSEPTLDDLRDIIQSCPGIDNHAHNLLLPTSQDAYSLLNATTEATGDALQDTHRSLPHLRMVRQLRELYDCPKASWEQLMEKRQELLQTDAAGLFRKCFEGIHTILMDDGLDSKTVHSYDWHDQFTPGRTYRIVRIETVAADIMRDLFNSGRLHIESSIEDDECCADIWITFLDIFEAKIADFIRDDEVVGFKSVICYRSGLDVNIGEDVRVATVGLDAFRDQYLPECFENDFRIGSKGLNDCILISTCRLLTAGLQQTGIAKPLQFHTGLGDNDISLLRSNPAYLQPLIENFPSVQFVLLHSSYPYTREAGYLATVFKNVFLDLGEVFPMVSRDGQEHIIRQAMELTPMSKLLYSTDAHHWSEVYWLADKQFRHAFGKALVDYVENEDLTVQQAIDAAKDIYFNNSNLLYNLDLDFPKINKYVSRTTGGWVRIMRLEARALADQVQKPLQLKWKEGQVPRAETAAATSITPDAELFQSIMQKHATTQFICVQWLDYMAIMRARMFPVKEFSSMISKQGRFGIARGSLGVLQNDNTTAAVYQGLVLVQPDLSTLRKAHSKNPLQVATVTASFTDEEGTPLAACPRATLQGLITQFENDHHITFHAGFEIELVLLRRAGNRNDLYEPSDTIHAWSTLTPEQSSTTLPIIAEIVTELANMDIHIQQFHSESGPGQYEIVLPPLPILLAIDTLITARQVVHEIAHSHNLRATLHPTPHGHTGSGQHVHLSLHSTPLTALNPESLEQNSTSFFAAVLDYLPAICAFSLPNESSYARVQDNAWAGGTWCCYGTQNREVPLRKITATRWEVRCLDGFANPYLALAAILAAGLEGVEQRVQMKMRDCLENPAELSEEARGAMGIVRRLPQCLGEALDALGGLGGGRLLKRDGGVRLCEDYVVMKRAEMSMLGEMTEEERRVWLIERY